MERTGSLSGPRKTRPTCGTAPSTSVSPGSKVSVQSLSSVIALRSTAALPTAFAFAASIGKALQPDGAGSDGERRLGLVEGHGSGVDVAGEFLIERIVGELLAEIGRADDELTALGLT